MKRIAVVNKDTNIVENVIVAWECPDGCEAVELAEDAQETNIGDIHNGDGTFEVGPERAAKIKELEAKKKAAEALKKKGT